MGGYKIRDYGCVCSAVFKLKRGALWQQAREDHRSKRAGSAQACNIGRTPYLCNHLSLVLLCSDFHELHRAPWSTRWPQLLGFQLDVLQGALGHSQDLTARRCTARQGVDDEGMMPLLVSRQKDLKLPCAATAWTDGGGEGIGAQACYE